MSIRKLPENTPEKIDNHDVLVFVLHELMMPKKVKPDGERYITIPKKTKRILAKITGGCSKDYNTLSEEDRQTWWHAHYDNMRFFLELGGREGGKPTQERMRISHEYWSENQDEALTYAMTTFRNNNSKDLEEFIQNEMA